MKARQLAVWSLGTLCTAAVGAATALISERVSAAVVPENTACELAAVHVEEWDEEDEVALSSGVFRPRVNGLHAVRCTLDSADGGGAIAIEVNGEWAARRAFVATGAAASRSVSAVLPLDRADEVVCRADRGRGPGS